MYYSRQLVPIHLSLHLLLIPFLFLPSLISFSLSTNKQRQGNKQIYVCFYVHLPNARASVESHFDYNHDVYHVNN